MVSKQDSPVKNFGGKCTNNTCSKSDGSCTAYYDEYTRLCANCSNKYEKEFSCFMIPYKPCKKSLFNNFSTFQRYSPQRQKQMATNFYKLGQQRFEYAIEEVKGGYLVRIV